MSDEKINMPELFKLEKVTLKRTNKNFAEQRIKTLHKNLEYLQEFLPFATADYNIDDELNYIKSCDEKWQSGKAYDYSIFENSTGEYIGSCSLFQKSSVRKVYEFGYWIVKNKQGNGYVTSIVKYLSNYVCENLNPNRLVIACNTVNKKSAGVAIRNGYLFEHKEFCADRGEDAYYFVKLIDAEKHKELKDIQAELKKIYKIEG